MKVGDTIWRFDINHRVYPKPEPGRYWSSGGPIYRHHWRPTQITGETSRSWLTSLGKCPKKGQRQGWALTEQEVDADVWVKSHRHRISHAVGSVDDPEVLRQIANLISYSATDAETR